MWFHTPHENLNTPEEQLGYAWRHLDTAYKEEKKKGNLLACYLYNIGLRLHEIANEIKKSEPGFYPYIAKIACVALTELTNLLYKLHERDTLETEFEKNVLTDLSKYKPEEVTPERLRSAVCSHYRHIDPQKIQRLYEKCIQKNNDAAFSGFTYTLPYLKQELDFNKVKETSLFKNLYFICSLILTGSDRKGGGVLEYEIGSSKITLNYSQNQMNEDKLAKILLSQALAAYTIKMAHSKTVKSYLTNLSGVYESLLETALSKLVDALNKKGSPVAEQLCKLGYLLANNTKELMSTHPKLYHDTCNVAAFTIVELANIIETTKFEQSDVMNQIDISFPYKLPANIKKQDITKLYEDKEKELTDLLVAVPTIPDPKKHGIARMCRLCGLILQGCENTKYEDQIKREIGNHVIILEYPPKILYEKFAISFIAHIILDQCKKMRE